MQIGIDIAAKPAKRAKRKKHGFVTVAPYEKAGLTYYSVECRRKEVSKEDQRRSFSKKKDAEQWAATLNKVIAFGKAVEHDDERTLELKQLSKEIDRNNILELYHPNWLGRKVTLPEVMKAGMMSLHTIININQKRRVAGLRAYTDSQAMKSFEAFEFKEAEKSKAPKITEFIKKMLAHKLSRTGGKGNKTLKPKTINEWKRMLPKIDSWIGHYSSKEDTKLLRETVINSINSGVNEHGRHRGEFWGETTKNRYASKANEFGIWMVEEEYWLKNPFVTLPSKFPKAKTTQATTLSVAEVEKLFAVAATNGDYRMMIPYMTFIFFSGARPEEIASDDSDVRHEWKDMLDWKHDSPVTKGLLFFIPAEHSKMSKDRYADLTANGVEWLEWFFLEVLGCKELPNRGKVQYSRTYWEAIREEALDRDWPQDVARHTFSSVAHKHSVFKKNGGDTEYWCETLGHTPNVFKQRYNAPKLPKEIKGFFEITPRKVLSD